MEFISQKKKLLYAGCAFFLGMFLLTLVSKGVYAAGLAQVSTVSSQKREIGHVVEAEGIVMQGREQAVSTLSGLKVKSVDVELGDTVSGNTLLFELDKDYLQDQIAQQELEVLKLQKNIAQIEENKVNEEAKKQLAENRTLEDYALTDTEEDRKIDQAGEQVADAQKKLQENAAKQPEVTPEEERKEKNQSYQEWLERDKELKAKQLALSSELKKAEAEEESAKKALERYLEEHGMGGGTGSPEDGTGGTGPGTDVPANGVDGTGTGTTDEPGNGMDETEPGTVEPGSGAGGMGTGTDEPGNGTDETEPGTVEPGSGAGGTGTGIKEPGNGTGETENGTKEPENGAGGTGTGTKEPENGAGGTGTGTKESGTGAGIIAAEAGTNVPVYAKGSSGNRTGGAPNRRNGFIAGGAEENGLINISARKQAGLQIIEEEHSAGRELAAAAEDTRKKELEQALAAATARRQEIQEKLNAVEDELARHELNAKEKPDYTAEDGKYESWKSTQEALEDSLDGAQQAQEDSVWGKLDAMLEAKRKVEDSTLPGNADKQLEISRAELALRQQILERYHTIEKNGGRIYSESEGVVTNIKVSAGELTTEGASIVVADLTDSFRFSTTITKEQKKYVDIGDTVNLKLGKSGKEIEVTVDYMAESPGNPELYELVIKLPEGVGKMGQSGKMTASVKSDSYPVTIPVEALHSENQVDFIYVLRKQAGILGEELAVTRTPVKILDQNDKYAAIEAGSLEKEDEIVIFSTKELEDGMVVRYQLE